MPWQHATPRPPVAFAYFRERRMPSFVPLSKRPAFFAACGPSRAQVPAGTLVCLSRSVNRQKEAPPAWEEIDQQFDHSVIAQVCEVPAHSLSRIATSPYYAVQLTNSGPMNLGEKRMLTLLCVFMRTAIQARGPAFGNLERSARRRNGTASPFVDALRDRTSPRSSG